MHELSICKSIVDIVERNAAGRTVEVVRVRIGELRQVVPDTLVYCWSLVTEQTPLDGSELRVERIAVAIRCPACDRTETLDELLLLCGQCGSTDVEIVAGEEFLITGLELAEAREPHG